VQSLHHLNRIQPRNAVRSVNAGTNCLWITINLVAAYCLFLGNRVPFCFLFHSFPCFFFTINAETRQHNYRSRKITIIVNNIYKVRFIINRGIPPTNFGNKPRNTPYESSNKPRDTPYLSGL
jgi:hypothetical protein